MSKNILEKSKALAFGAWEIELAVPGGTYITKVEEGVASVTIAGVGTAEIYWGETMPMKPIRAALAGDQAVPSGAPPEHVAVGLLQEAAAQVLTIGGMSPRDRNAIVGQLRNVAAQIRGFGGLAEWPTAPFGPPKANT